MSATSSQSGTSSACVGFLFRHAMHERILSSGLSCMLWRPVMRGCKIHVPTSMHRRTGGSSIAAEKDPWQTILCVTADTLLDNLTVYEMLAYTAELKNPMKEPFEKKRAKVEMVIQQLGLNGCRGVRIGSTLARGISGEPLVGMATFLLESPWMPYLAG